MTTVSNSLRRPMDMGQIVNTAIRVYRRNFGEFVAIAAVALPIVAGFAVTEALVDGSTWNVVGAALLIPLLAVVIIVQAAITQAVVDIADGVAPEFNSVYLRVFRRLGLLLTSGLRVFLGMVVLCLTVVGIPFAMYLLVRWIMFTPVIMTQSDSTLQEVDVNTLLQSGPKWARSGILGMFERRFSSRASAMSARIVEGFWWRTLGILVVIYILANVPTGLVGVAALNAPPVGSSLLSAVALVMVLPFMLIAYTLLFFDLQSRERERASVA